MLFNSYEFIFAFLPITFLIYFYLSHKRFTYLSKVFLIVSSLFFYSWWNPIYLPLILISIIFNYSIGVSLTKERDLRIISKKKLLIVGIIGNLGLLSYFKYSDFFIENYNLAFDKDIPLLNLALPLAISFFTFQQIAYLIDSYRKETKEYDFINYMMFVTFFPQLIAGPIVHHKEVMPQFARKKNKIINYRNISSGVFIFSIGLFKKVMIADTFATWATSGYDYAYTLNFLEGWITSLSYTFQIYYDFSGYADMAIGAALLFNIKLPTNFNSPYKATSIQDFWKRWHITLGVFLRDYVYIPLGGNKMGNYRTYLNIMITLLLGGLWHGAGWTFIFWGFLHAFALIVHRIWSSLNFKLWSWLAWLITFNYINITFVFFRANEWDDAIKVLNAMININNIVLPHQLEDALIFLNHYGISFGNWSLAINANNWTIIWILCAFIQILVFKNSNQLLNNFKSSYFSSLFSAMLFGFSALSLYKVSEFLYFNF